MDEAQQFQLLQEQALDQQHALSQVAMQTIALLAKSQVEVDALIAARIASNPALRRITPRRCRWCAAVLEQGQCMRCGSTRLPLYDASATSDLREQLRVDARQLVQVRLGPLVDLVMDELDERGLLTTALSRLAVIAGVRPADVEAALTAVQEIGPPGVAAADVRASLIAQARWHVDRGATSVLLPLVQHHLEAIAGGDLDALALAMNASPAELAAAAKFVRTRLTPAPLPLDHLSAQPSQPPDLIIKAQADGSLLAEALGAADLGLELDPPTAVDLLPIEAQRWWAEQAKGAKELLDIVDRRAGAMRRIGAALVQLQGRFIREGAIAHRPLSRSQLAAHLGLNPSTVSRAVQHATAAVPGGRVLQLSAFFGGAVAARETLAEMLASDHPPASDTEATHRLAEAGFSVARRTVAKYRGQIPAQRLPATPRPRTALRNIGS